MIQRNWHIFCRVIDNFGDIGVCWRLAKQLHQQHSQAVTLWVDDLVSLQALCPAAQIEQAQQTLEGINLCRWSDALDAGVVALAEVVIEAFGCELPNSVLAQMRAQQPPPIWLNLEYLSAETWVDDFHGLPSPVQGMQKTFFFPGFSDKTGGLLWEPELLDLPMACNHRAARQQLMQAFGLAPELAQRALQLSLFAYENTQVAGLLDALSQYSQTVHVFVPQGRVAADVERWLGQALQPHCSYQRGQLVVSGVPFMAQPDYDRLLASCDLNIVRGEESFVRAQMLGLPLLWHIYQQQEDAHLVKLDAFLDRYLDAANAELRQTLASVFRGWNQPQNKIDWPRTLQALPEWSIHAKQWQYQQKSHGNLAQNLVRHVQTRYSAGHFITTK